MQEYWTSFKQSQRSRMAALRATLQARAKASVAALQALERHPVRCAPLGITACLQLVTKPLVLAEHIQRIETEY